MNVIHKKPWAIAEREATPEAVFWNRRKFLAGVAGGSLGLGALAANPGRALAEEDPSAGLYPVPRNEAFVLDRDLTKESVASTYNNFYEFGTHKEIASAAQALPIRPWTVQIDGLVDNPQTIDIDALLAKMPLEERLYRHRCVEAWSMAVPWSGFALAELVKLAGPTSDAKYLRFETFHNPEIAPGQKQGWYPWPYVEGLSLAEATNDLAFMATGVYGKPLAKQFGAPLRLAVPWKYGFKSIKSIVRISFVEERPVGLWEAIQSKEYGFWANVNPGVPHPRWSQSSERILGTSERRNTLMFNGYGEQVAELYKDMKGEALYM
ncbi:protein-methionine-sulfoxide reductase catalytic subunit MsrP [Roseibium polysiphoniae]|uniref:Protein-methionine-sulfoxide reductase catalytic subunit MsrP n=1 Tax=Roseibium polysiphoniae TaxID=2571221 RepID=A0ABR9C8C0_9HYPH|nr:protein-methionine-sulfoxide reductase catalytic subunit MsrP [Roseibium polysiphoniae]MBD8876149.1 protein-methionine-sulfoxide reductase catalytic subunit MsrP [Roseibium polysiphoniae]